MTKKIKSYHFLLIGVAIIYIALMATFTFYDYDVTNHLFNPKTLFGKIFEVIGPSPMPIFVIYSTISLFFFVSFKKKISQIFAYIGLGFALTYASVFGVLTFKYSYAYWLFVPSILLYLIEILLTIYINLRIKKNNNSSFIELHILICLAIFIVAFASLLGSDVIKSIFGRVRYIKLASRDDYLPWYHINKFDFNSSFPSGHASRSLSIICISFLLYYFHKEKWCFVVETLSLTFAFVVSYTRMMEGMHYPTDLLTGIMITLIPYIICKNVILRKNLE